MHSPQPLPPRPTPSRNNTASPPTPPRSVSPLSNRRRSSSHSNNSSTSSLSQGSSDSWAHRRGSDTRTPGTSEDGRDDSDEFDENKERGGAHLLSSLPPSHGSLAAPRPSNSRSTSASSTRSPSSPLATFDARRTHAVGHSIDGNGSTSTRLFLDSDLLTPPRSPQPQHSPPRVLRSARNYQKAVGVLASSSSEDPNQDDDETVSFSLTPVPSSSSSSCSSTTLPDTSDAKTAYAELDAEQSDEAFFREVDALIQSDSEQSHHDEEDSDWSVLDDGEGDDGDEDTDTSNHGRRTHHPHHLQTTGSSTTSWPLAWSLSSSSSSSSSKLPSIKESVPLRTFSSSWASNRDASYLPLHNDGVSSSSSSSSPFGSSLFSSFPPRLSSFLSPTSSSIPTTSSSSHHSSTARYAALAPLHRYSRPSPSLPIKLVQTLSLLLLPPIFLAIPIAISLYFLGELYYYLGFYFFDWYSTAYTGLFWVLTVGAMLAYGWAGFWMIARMGKGLVEVWGVRQQVHEDNVQRRRKTQRGSDGKRRRNRRPDTGPRSLVGSVA